MAKDYKKIFPDTRNEGNTELEKLQSTLTRMLCIFDDVCKEHNLTYWLDCGTLLGAVRHKGFIPWDDDVDLAMPRKDYERLKEIADDVLPKEIYFQTNKRDTAYRYYWAKLRDRKSIAMERWERNNEGKYHMGIMIDIFPYDYIKHPKSYFFFKNWFVCQFKNKTFNFLMRIIRGILVFSFRKKNVIKFANWFYGRNKDTKYFGKGYDSPFRSVYEVQDILPVKKIPFGKYEFCVPNNTNKYLTSLYGDYMTPPSIEEQKSSAHFLKFDVNKPCLFEEKLRKEGK
ncbi:cholinephosphotransferase (plasmid) [Fulvitalea axinellae]|uniref:Cholinephosphotransferase n=1 Tax=Fulvitalea axinellae TaxID=1182444 RepID=A0AAU9D2X3_9BACT|nr:cholinephosphotransferase [Fulvitalea axinellae]